MAVILDFRSERVLLFFIYKSPSQLAFWFRRRIKNIDFSDGGRLGFLIGTILAIFDLQIIDASYQVSSQLAFRFRGRSEKIDFQDGGHDGNLRFLIGKT